MTTELHPPIVRAYLDELRGLLAGSPDRDLVLDGVQRHIEEQLAAGVAAREVLDGLGDPAAIAAEAAPATEGTSTSSAPPAFLDRRSGALVTVLVLTFGGLVVPVLGWIVGLVMLWASRGWRTVDKLVGTLPIPAAMLVIVLVRLLLPTNMGCAAGGGEFCAPVAIGFQFPTHLAVMVAVVAVPLAIATYLLLRFRPRQ